MSSQIEWGRVVLGVAGLLLFAYLLSFGPLAEGASDLALRILSLALSILAGILLAIMTMLGDPRILYPGSWRVASAHQRQIRRALDRSVWLFRVYLLVIALAFAGVLLEAYVPVMLDGDSVRWVKHIALSLGSVALLWSFSLPAAIRKAQLARLDEEVERRYEEARLSPSDDTARHGAS